MPEIVSQYLKKAKQNSRIIYRFWSIALCLSFIVVISVFWYLKLTGITLAGEAFCGMEEHIHSEECQQNCNLTEHIHIESCYSNINADLETSDDWEASFANIKRGTSTAENIVLLSRSQLGVKESELNFEVGDDGVRRGITRYGQWYGNPYGDWSAMFASFCLHYAGVEDVPSNAGPETMRLEWNKQGLYKEIDEFSPQMGNLVFLNKKTELNNTVADSVAIIVSVDNEKITVIEGDADNEVKEVTYDINAKEILGYGLVPNVSEFAVLVEPPKDASTIASYQNFNSNMLTSSNRFVIYTIQNGIPYAIDGTGKAVQILVDENGKLRTDYENPDLLLWTFARYNNSSTAIQNVGSGRYLHPFYNGASDNGITTPGRWGTTVTASGVGAKFSHSAYIALDIENEQFVMTRTQNQNLTFMFGVSSPCTVWFDGTNGGIMSLGGSDNSSVTAYTDGVITLPMSWKSPVKYDYTLKGWYDITNHKYYAPGDKVIVTGNMVFYADWKSTTYDVGKFNSQTDNETISTNKFIKTRMFDYGVLFNVLSETVDISVDANSHSETWRLLTSGNNPYNGEPTLNYIFRDWDRGSEDISYPSGHNDRNNPTDAGTVFQGLYTDKIKELLFNPEITLPGKEYLGEGDYLFQLCEDHTHDHYGYYYYNSERNAASYNQTDQRFYVYDYLEATRDSLNGSDNGRYSDFLPLNSPYANTNGKKPTEYTYSGIDGEYTGTTHYMYDSKYNTDNNSTNNMGTNYWFGMSVEISFYLPNVPGSTVVNGEFGNKDVYGENMHFKFTGDDDVWVFVDDKMVLDLGGLHGRETGDINFSTGEVTINGVKDNALSNVLQSVSSGEHKLTLYYLERGSSLSNCAIYFNLAPRFDFTIQKEDILTKDVLNGAQFSVFTDKECTIPAELWESKESHDNNDPSTNVFTVKNGVAHMWGMGAGNVYYVKETKPPDNKDYGLPNGIIRITFDKSGTASYSVEIIDGGSGVSPGFIVHGFRIDAETQEAYIVATNAPEWVEETTVVQALKHWNDSLDHSNEEITVYLTVTNSDGTVTRLQEAHLSAENNWLVKWDNLPKYDKDGKTLFKYGVEESYVSGYYSTIETVTGHFQIANYKWQNVDTFENGKVYILKNSSGQALSTQRQAEDTGYMWVSEEVAKTSDLAKWKASVNGSNVRLTNLAGQTITFYYGNGSPTDFYAFNQLVEDNNRKQYFRFTKTTNGINLRYNNNYLYSALNNSQKFQTGTQSSRALILTLATEKGSTSDIPIEELGFLIENTPLEKETSVTVSKDWVIPDDMDITVYEQERVTIQLYANGIYTGRTVTLNLKNSWTAVFKGLPYEDADGNVIKYTVKEIEFGDNWLPNYGEIITTGSSPPNYSVTVTNTYYTGGPILPTTGSFARLLFILCGAAIMLTSLIYGIWFRRNHERRSK